MNDSDLIAERINKFDKISKNTLKFILNEIEVNNDVDLSDIMTILSMTLVTAANVFSQCLETTNIDILNSITNEALKNIDCYEKLN